MGHFRVYNATGAAAIDIDRQMGVPYKLAEVRLHLSATTTDLANLTIAIDSSLGAAYDVLIVKPTGTDLTTITDWRYAPEVPPLIFPGDVLKIDWANTGTKTYGIEIIGCD
jgi:hypothetical protein